MENSTAKVGRYIDLMFDRGFKRVFGKPANKDLLIALLNAVLPEKGIVDLTYLNTETEGLGPESKKTTFDVQCSLGDGSRIIVEVQNSNQAYFKERVLYYASLPILEQLDKGDEYRLYPVYVISILDFALKHDDWDGRIRSSYSLREDICGERMTDALQFVFLELGRFHKTEAELDNDLEKWYFCLLRMRNLAKRPASMQAEVFKRLFDVSEVAALPKEEQEQYIRDMTTERDIINQKAFARNEGLEQGLARGRAEGEAIGMSKGRAEGRSEGRAEGKAEGRSEVARAMLLENISIETIAKVTGLSAEQIRAL